MNSQSDKKTPIALLAAASAGIAFGCMGTGSQLMARQGFGLTEIAASQFIVAALVMGVLSLAKFRNFPDRSSCVKLLGVGLLQPISALCLYCGIDNLTVGQAVAIQFQYVWLTIAIQSAVDRKLPSGRVVLAALVIIVGTLLASGVAEDVLSDNSALNAVGIAFSVACAIAYSFFLFFNGRVAVDTHPVPRSFLLLVSGAVITAIMAPELFAGGLGHIAAIAPGALVLGLMTTVPVLCVSYASSRISGGTLAILTSMELPAAVVTGVVVLADPTSIVKIAGVSLIMIGIIVSEIGKKPR